MHEVETFCCFHNEEMYPMKGFMKRGLLLPESWVAFPFVRITSVRVCGNCLFVCRELHIYRYEEAVSLCEAIFSRSLAQSVLVQNCKANGLGSLECMLICFQFVSSRDLKLQRHLSGGSLLSLKPCRQS